MTRFYLIAWGGCEPGKRPRTKVAQAMGRTNDDGSRIFVQVERSPGSYYNPTWLERGKVLAEFASYPTSAQLQTAREKLETVRG